VATLNVILSSGTVHHPDDSPLLEEGFLMAYRRTSISGTKKAQITFPLRHNFPLKVVK
jgi:hypothetical protein